MKKTTLYILIGTMTGTSQLVAEEIEFKLENSDYDVKIFDMGDVDKSIFENEGLFLICTSTYGQGDIPDNAKKLYQELQQQKKNSSNINYGIFALGDKTYKDTYCFGGKKFDDLLSNLGFNRIGQIKLNDAGDEMLPEETAVRWIDEWLSLYEKIK